MRDALDLKAAMDICIKKLSWRRASSRQSCLFGVKDFFDF
jgi:hypothetical protein